MKRLIVTLLLCGLFAASAAAQSTIFIVRHAEKATGGGNDPDLSRAGRARAKSLAGILKEVGITAIYATEFKRTQETAAPLAKIIGIDVVRIPGKSTANLVTKLHNLQGNAALVVGHSNTIPLLIKALGINAPIGNHSFRATGITAYLSNGGALEHAQEMAGHESPRTTKLYDRTKERLTQDEVERIRL